MIIKLKKGITKKETSRLLTIIEEAGLNPFLLEGAREKVVVVMGDEQALSKKSLLSIPVVDSVLEVSRPYKLASRELKLEDTVISVGGIKIGSPGIVIMAGPCSVENEKQIIRIAKEIKKAGAHVLRGGAFKPRTSPYSFQGLGKPGLEHLAKAAKLTGLKIITELLDPRDVNLVGQFTDIFQIGARNMQNFPLLKEVGRTKKPVLLKRGMWATYREFLLAAEYIMAGGNRQVMLCERGIRTHVNELRFTLDLNAIPYLKRETHLPVIVDPSHGTGEANLVSAMSKAAIAAGADGLLIETHFAPKQSISDVNQTISISDFRKLMRELKKIAKAVGRKIHEGCLSGHQRSI